MISAKFSPTCIKILTGPAGKEDLDYLGVSSLSCRVQRGSHKPAYIISLVGIGPACKEVFDKLDGSVRSCQVQGGVRNILFIYRRLVGIGALA